MSVRAQAWLPAAKDDLGDIKGTLLKLRGTRAALLAVRDYWASVGENCGKYESEWQASLFGEDRICFNGPGGFSVRLESGSIVINASCRWSGFCTISDLQKVHADAFVSIARALGESRLLIFLDGSALDDYLYDKLTLEEYVEILRNRWGECRTQFGIVTDNDEEYYSMPSPKWFLINL